MKDHKPIVIEEFRGLWRNGDAETCPLDHFSDCNNIVFGESSFETRPGINTYSDGGGILRQGVLRMYNYDTENGETLLILIEGGTIYHSLLDGSNTIYEILTIPDMEDFDFHSFDGRAYITPFKTYTHPTGENYQLGLPDQFVYVYKGDGTPARKAAGFPPLGGSSGLVGYNGESIGEVTYGIHILAVSSANDTDLSEMGPEGLTVVFAPGDRVIHLNNIPLGEAATTKRNIYMTKAIPPEEWHVDSDGDLRDEYEFFLAKVIDDNITKSTVINIKDEIDPDDATDTNYLKDKFTGGHGDLNTPTNSNMYAENSATDGYCDLGLHVLGVVFETDTGYLTAPGPEFFAVQTFVNDQKSIELHNIPVSPDSHVVKRHVVSTVALNHFNGNNRAGESEFQMFFVPGGEINNNTDTNKMLSFYDSELIDDASHLIDNFPEIPAGVGLGSYNGRMAVWGIHGGDDATIRSLCYFSAKGEPEAIDQVEGFVKFPVDGKPLTNGQEFRDVFYLFKQTKTAVTVDNGQSPAFWGDGTAVILDHGLGASVHGICKVLDSDGVNVEYILIVDWTGIMVFNGRYLFPALTFKIETLWHELHRNFFATIQILCDSIEHQLYMILPNKQMLYADWSDGLDAKNIKWTPWTFDIETTTIALIETNKLLIGSNKVAETSVLMKRPDLKRRRRS